MAPKAKTGSFDRTVKTGSFEKTSPKQRTTPPFLVPKAKAGAVSSAPTPKDSFSSSGSSPSRHTSSGSKSKPPVPRSPRSPEPTRPPVSTNLSHQVSSKVRSPASSPVPSKVRAPAAGGAGYAGQEAGGVTQGSFSQAGFSYQAVTEIMADDFATGIQVEGSDTPIGVQIEDGPHVKMSAVQFNQALRPHGNDTVCEMVAGKQMEALLAEVGLESHVAALKAADIEDVQTLLDFNKMELATAIGCTPGVASRILRAVREGALGAAYEATPHSSIEVENDDRATVMAFAELRIAADHSEKKAEKALAEQRLAAESSAQKAADLRKTEMAITEQRIALERALAEKAEMALAEQRLAAESSEKRAADLRKTEIAMTEQCIALERALSEKAEMALAEQRLAAEISERKAADLRKMEMAMSEQRMALERALAETSGKAMGDTTEKVLAEEHLAEEIAEKRAADLRKTEMAMTEQRITLERTLADEERERTLAEQRDAEEASEKRVNDLRSEMAVADERVAALTSERKVANDLPPGVNFIVRGTKFDGLRCTCMRWQVDKAEKDGGYYVVRMKDGAKRTFEPENLSLVDEEDPSVDKIEVRPKDLFSAIDADHDGSVTRAEFENYVSRQAPIILEGQSVRVLKTVVGTVPGSTNKTDLAVGTLGEVNDIDEDGDAYIKFEAIGYRFVKATDFSRLEVVEAEGS